jgi:hypothetical protein
MDKTEQSIKSVPQSQFVTVLAWIFIVITVFSTVISIMQNIMIVFFPFEKMQPAFSQPRVQEHIPAFFALISSHIRLIFFSFFVLSSTGVVSSIGLLKRKNWARIVFIILMSLRIVWTVSGVVLLQILLSSFPKILPQNQFQIPQFEYIIVVVKIFTIVIAISFSLLFGWIIRKLTRSDIRAEFTT